MKMLLLEKRTRKLLLCHLFSVGGLVFTSGRFVPCSPGCIPTLMCVLPAICKSRHCFQNPTSHALRSTIGCVRYLERCRWPTLENVCVGDASSTWAYVLGVSLQMAVWCMSPGHGLAMGVCPTGSPGARGGGCSQCLWGEGSPAPGLG